jgi:hypothetical protein
LENGKKFRENSHAILSFSLSMLDCSQLRSAGWRDWQGQNYSEFVNLE